MTKSTRKRRSRKSATAIDKPPKPYPDFPLGPHNNGRWQKRIRGKLHYFGRWGRIVKGTMERLPGDGVQEALQEYEEQREALYAGRTPRVKGDGLTIKDLCNGFLRAKLRQVEAGEIAARTFTEYRNITDRLVSTFGKERLVDDLAAEDFERLRSSMARQWGPVRLGNAIQYTRSVFKYGYEAALIDKPMRFGPQFKKPSKSVLRRHRVAGGKRLFEPTEIRALLDAASPQVKAMILLGINAGFGNSDVANLPQSAVELDAGWIDFPRPKTGIERRCPLWPETVKALQAAIAERPVPKDAADADLVFVTRFGKRWVRTEGEKSTPINSVGHEFGKLMRQLQINGRRGLGFYSLRHSFRTIADATKDFPAVRLIMGHADGSIDDVYRESIEDARLRDVAHYVRAWLFGNDDGDDSSGKGEQSNNAEQATESRPATDHDDGRPKLRIVG